MNQYEPILIKNVNVVLENSVIYNTSILIDEGLIKDIDCGNVNSPNIRILNANGSFLLPGFVDLHCDSIEKEIEVRPGVLIPMDIAILELDKKMAMAGITTIFHSISFAERSINKAVIRTVEIADKVIQKVKEMSEKLGVDNRIHLRYEITYTDAIPLIEDLIKKQYVDLVSIMDHTPGQGQFKTLEQFVEYYKGHFNDNFDMIKEVIENKQKLKQAYGLDNAKKVSEICQHYGIPLASHDDDTVEKIDFVYSCGACISEFPMKMDVAHYAHDKGLKVVVGSPNIIRGWSHNKNINAIDVIKAQKADIICSDYIPSTLIYAFDKLFKENLMPVYEISKMFSLNPAKAVKLDDKIGKIEIGYNANVIIVDFDGEYPKILKTFVNGVEMYSSCKKKRLV